MLGDSSNASEEFGERNLQTARDLLNVDQRDIPNASLYAAVVSAMETAPFSRFFLIDTLFLANATGSTTKSDSDIERHRFRCLMFADDA
jgi:hypothetical protein